MGLSFKSPNFGNTFNENIEFVVRKTTGGETKIVYDSSWPKTTQLSVEISGLSQSDRDRFVLFYIASAGQRIQFTDHEGTNWNGFITTSNPQIIQYGKGCQFRTSFNFEGVKV